MWKDITIIGAETVRGIHMACHMISSDIITKIFMNSNAIHYIKPEQAEILDIFNSS